MGTVLGILLAFGGGVVSAITGSVTDGQGVPVTDALVRVQTARPIVGPSVVCPSCYRDCGRFARTDERGEFEIRGLDTRLFYQLIIVAADFHHQKTNDVADNDNLTIVLDRRGSSSLGGSVIRGRLLGELSEAPAYSVITTLGYIEDGRTIVGEVPATDPLVIADEAGRFALHTFPSAQLRVLIEPAGYAPKAATIFADAAGPVIQLERGWTARGVATSGGHPVEGAIVGIAPALRDAMGVYQSTELATNESGAFLLPNIPTGRDYVLYVKMSSAGRLGYRTRAIQGPTHSGSIDLGELKLQAVSPLYGTISGAQGRCRGARLQVIRPDVDYIIATIDERSQFRVHGVPDELTEVVLHCPGFRLSPRNRGFQAKTEPVSVLVTPRARRGGITLLVEPSNAD